jgi:hypothetical protein
MPRIRLILKLFVVLALIVAADIGTISIFTEAQAGGPCRCPLIYAPVQCDHGKVYPNQCAADCHNAKNCVPLPL